MTDPINEWAGVYRQQEAERQAGIAKAAAARRLRDQERAEHARTVMSNETEIRNLAGDFLRWATRNGVGPMAFDAGRFGLFTGWEIASATTSSGDPNSYSGESENSYRLRLSRSGRLFVVCCNLGSHVFGKRYIWRRTRYFKIGQFGIGGVQQGIGKIVATSGKRWP